MEIVNLTPHLLRLSSPSGEITELPASGSVARVRAIPGDLEEVNGIPVPVAGASTYGEVEGLPCPSEGTIFIVSGLVGSRCQGREDVFVPGTGPQDGAVRREGRIFAVTRLNRTPLPRLNPELSRSVKGLTYIAGSAR